MSAATFNVLDEIDLSSRDFWARPLSERYEAFALLRREQPIAFFAEPQDLDIPVGKGYDAVHPPPRRDRGQPAPRAVLLRARGRVDPTSPRSSTSSSRACSPPTTPATPGCAASSNAFTRGTSTSSRSSSSRRPARVHRVRSLGSCDFVEEVAAPFPLRIICELMGVPESEHASCSTARTSSCPGATPSTSAPTSTPSRPTWRPVPPSPPSWARSAPPDGVARSTTTSSRPS